MTQDSKSLDIKYRPKSLDDIVGNESTVTSLKSKINSEVGIGKSLLFIGPSGCGKTTLAKIIKTELNCHEKDYHYFNASNTRGIDTIRNLESTARYLPLGGKIKFYVLDECHMLTKEAQNALLLLLEDPPKHVFFALCTTNPEKVIDTIKTRCNIYTVQSLPSHKIIFLLKRVISKELEQPLPDNLLKEIAYASQGSSRRALKLLDQVIDIENDEEAMNAIIDSTVSETTTLEICQELLKPGKNKWATLAPMIKNIDAEAETLRYAILGYFNAVLLNQKSDNDRVAEMLSIFIEPGMYSGKAGITLQIYLACNV